jgi:hypothetical protein
MTNPHPAPDHHSILNDTWADVGSMDWLKSALFSEFSDHRPLPAVVADMLVSLVPCIVIVTKNENILKTLKTAPDSKIANDLCGRK